MISEFELQIIATLQSFFDRFGWFGVIILMIFEGATSLTPIDIVLGLAGWLLLANHDSPPVMVFIAGLFTAFGSTLGSSIAYWIVRLGGRPLLDQIARRFRFITRYIQSAEAQFQRRGPGLVLFGRVIPGIRILVTIPAGLARMPFFSFFTYTLIGTYIYCTFFLGAGYLVGQGWSSLQKVFDQYAPWLPLAILVLAGLALAARQIVHQRLRIQAVIAPVKEEK